MGARLWLADFSRHAVEPGFPKSIACLMDYYKFDGSTAGLSDDAVETELLGRIEHDAACVISHLLDGNFSLTDPQRGDLAHYMAFQVTRTPAWRSSCQQIVGDMANTWLRASASNREYFEGTFREANSASGLSAERLEELRRKFLDSRVDRVRATSTASLAFMIEVASTITRFFFTMCWRFALAPLGHHFVTCDNPVFWYDATMPARFAYGLGSPRTVVTYPLGPELALLMSHCKDVGGRERVDEDVVLFVNARMVRSAERFVFAARKEEAHAALALRRKLVSAGIEVGPRKPQLWELQLASV